MSHMVGFALWSNFAEADGCSAWGGTVILKVTERALEDPGHFLLGFSPLLWELTAARLI